jgi:succinoglycan biosynthesis transport protein ExoP
MTEEQPIDIHHYTWAIRHALPRILVPALIAAIAAAVGSSLLSSKAYTASTTIVARDTLASNQSPDATTVTRRLATVNLLTRTTGVLSLAASKLPGTTVDELRSSVDSSVHPEANVITLVATADTADAAAARANQVAEALIATERRIEQQAATGALRAALTQVKKLRAQGATRDEIAAAENRVASLAANDVGSASAFQVVQAAEPGRPSSPPPWFSGVVAFFAIVVLGMILVLAREQVAPRVSSSQDLDQVFSIPLLASIPVVRRIKPNDLPDLPRGVRDAFYVLASAVGSKCKKHGTKIVFVVSAIRGEGRTTVAANLARALSISGASVLAVSADLRSPRLHKWLDTPQSPGLTDVLASAGLEGKVLDLAESARTAPSVTLERAIRAAISSKNEKLHVLPSGLAADDPTPLLFGDALSSAFNAIRALPYDFVVVDTPAGLGVPDIRALAPHADAFLVVARTDRLRMRAVVELRDLLDAFDKEKLGLAVFEREGHPISHLTPDESDKAHNGASGERGVVELR